MSNKPKIVTFPTHDLESGSSTPKISVTSLHEISTHASLSDSYLNNFVTYPLVDNCCLLTTAYGND